MLEYVAATASEKAETRPGDTVIAEPDVVMDRAFAVPGTPAQVWPWMVQLGKQRAGWYLTRSVERFIPPRRRAARSIHPRWQTLAIGDVIPDYGGSHETFTVAEIQPPHALVYRSQRGATDVTWSILLRPLPTGSDHSPVRTRVLLRLRMAPVKHVRLARTAGELIDLLTVAGLARGLHERLSGNGP